ncbi:MAG: alkaline phosphatase family protein [Alphaproteobacteria bacterium]
MLGDDRRSRLLALGLDGAEFDFIRARARDLPTLSGLIERGTVHRLEAPKALSGAVWPTFYNGAQPGVHGMYQHLVWDSARMGLRLIGPDWSHYQPFWKDIEADGQRVVVLDVPYSFPTALEHGVEITDWGTHGQTNPLASNKPEMVRRLRRFGRSPIGRETPIEKTPAQLDGIRRTLETSAARKADLVRTLMGELDWDLFITVFGETHRAGHLFFSDADDPNASADGAETPMLKVYKAVDQAVAKVLADLGSDVSVLLFSVHGMMRNPAQEHMVSPLMDRLNARFMAEHFGLDPRPANAGGGIVGALRRLVPSRLQYAVGEAAPDPIRRWVVEREVIGGLDWSRTPGFTLRTDVRTELRLNLKGREKHGLLERGSDLHHRYVDDIRRTFLELTDAETGARLVDEVVDIPGHFSGQRSDYLPDFAVTWHLEPPAGSVTTPLLGTVHVKRPKVRGGDHTDFGFCSLIPADGLGVETLPQPRCIEDLAGYIRAFTGRWGAQAQAA